MTILQEEPAIEPMADAPTPLDGEGFRRAGYALIDWIAEYRATVGQRAVAHHCEPGSIRAMLPPRAPPLLLR